MWADSSSSKAFHAIHSSSTPHGLHHISCFIDTDGNHGQNKFCMKQHLPLPGSEKSMLLPFLRPLPGFYTCGAPIMWSGFCGLWGEGSRPGSVASCFPTVLTPLLPASGSLFSSISGEEDPICPLIISNVLTKYELKMYLLGH